MTSNALSSDNAALPDGPGSEFAEFGPTEVVSLTRLKMLGARRLSQSWATIPHVTHHDRADVTQLEHWRRAPERGGGTPVSLLGAVMKAVSLALEAFPQFNASLGSDQKTLVLKRYYNLGIAIDTPAGLLVGVVRECDRKSAAQLSGEVRALAAKAKDKGLAMPEMTGGCFTISALGAIGGTGFTPIVNAPEVAILGLSSIEEGPRRGADDRIEWRQYMPISLSYDHRANNGADAARFARFICSTLADPAFIESL